MRYIVLWLLLLLPAARARAAAPLGTDRLAWLASIGNTPADGRAAVMDQHREWLTKGAVEDAVAALDPRTHALDSFKDDVAQNVAWLPAARGTVAVADRIGDSSLRATAIYGLARTTLYARKDAEAVPLAKSALDLWRQTGDEKAAARKGMEFACRLDDYWNVSGDPSVLSEDAIALLEASRAAFQKMGDTTAAAECGIHLADVHMWRREQKEAHALLDTALPIVEAAGRWDLVARGRFTRGKLYTQNLDARDLREYQSTLEAAERANDRLDMGQALFALATGYIDYGALAESRADMARVLEIVNTLPPSETWQGGKSIALAYCHAALGSLEMYSGRPELTLESDRLARQYAAELGNASLMAEMDLQDATAYDLAGNPARAIEAAMKARDGILALPMPDAGKNREAARMDGKIAKFLVEGQHWSEALEAGKRALTRSAALKESGDWFGFVEIHAAMARACQGLGRKAEALAYYEQAMTELRELRRSYGDASMGALGVDWLDGVAPALALMRLDDGKPEAAFQAAQQGKGTAMRLSLLGSAKPPTPEEQKRLDDLRATYREAARAASAGNAGPAESARQNDALAAMSGYELVLETKHPRWTGAADAPPSSADIARALDSHSAILEILVGDDRVCLMVLRNRDGRPVLTAHSVKAPTATLRQWADRLSRNLMDPNGDDHALAALSRRLYDTLIKPVEADLSGVRSLVVCPDQFLHAVPFGALQDHKGVYLTQKMGVMDAASASTWYACHAVAGRNRKKEAARPLVASVSRFNLRKALVARAPRSVTRGGALEDLPQAPKEARMVSEAFGGRVITLSGSEATVEAVEEDMPDARVLHFATHAFANDVMPMYSALVLSPSAENPLGLLYARDVYRQPLSADLAVLSACSTMEGRSTGEGLMGLAWSFMAAGCPSVVASRWPVEDSATAAWMSAFYTAYARDGRSKTDSARQANRALLQTRGAKSDFSSPRHWAAWTLLGDGGVARGAFRPGEK